MKAAFYNHTSDVSGAEISLLLTAGHMPGVEKVLLAPEGELLERAAEAGIPVVPLTSYRARLSRNPFLLIKHALGMLRSGYILAAAVRKQKVDVLHANSLRAGIMAALFVWLHRRPVIWHVRDIPPQGALGWAINVLASLTVDAIIGISKPVLGGFPRKSLQSRLHLVHNGLELQEMTREEHVSNRERLRKELDTPQHSAVLTIIGQIAPWKRQEDAIWAADRLLRNGHDVYLWVVGEAKFRQENKDYFESLRRLAAERGIADRIRFTGFRKDIQEICCAADLLLLCSDNEPFGRVIIEAMSRFVPVIATRAGGVPEIITEGESGLLYETGSIEGLVQSVEALLHNRPLRQSMGDAAAERVRGHFTIERTVEKIAAVYAGLGVKRRGNPKASESPLKSEYPRVAIVHDYLNQMGGAERVVGLLHRMFPDAPIYTTIADHAKLLPELKNAEIRTTWMQYIPGILKRFKHFFWLYPLAVRMMNLKPYDLVISSSSAYGKGAPVRKDAVHICYCHTPMRFAWEFQSYMESAEAPAMLRKAARLMMAPLRMWDRATSRQVDVIVANSSIVQERIRACYGRTAPVIYPPVNVGRFEVDPSPPGEHFLVVSRLVSYKRIDLAVEACTRTGAPLIVIGDGPDRKRLESLAGPNIRFMGRLPDEEVVRYMQTCRAFFFPGIEDFGITPLEVNACGRPVIAFRGGGALDTIVPGLNGVYFEEQTVDSLVKVLERFDDSRFEPARIRLHAEKFEESRFAAQLTQLIQSAMKTGKPAVAYGAPASSAESHI